MGNCLSGFAPPHLFDIVDGNDQDYHQHYIEDKVLGEGEFGVVKLVYKNIRHQQRMKQPTASNTGKNDDTDKSHTPTSTTSTPTTPTTTTTSYACKILQKGVVFKDNVLYTPLKPNILRGEIQMLRTLAGKHYCLQLYNIYESNTKLYIITECCYGGTMTQYVAASHVSTFTVHDVSRIAYQLLCAIQHCYRHNIIHRDIKPDNIMFIHSKPHADIRLIDFGSGCINDISDINNDSTTTTRTTTPATTTKKNKKIQYDIHGQQIHTTFAGSAFYTSPELYNRHYTILSDIWSIGVTLYVLVAGYPADALQKAFNILQCEHRNLHTLPNIPNNNNNNNNSNSNEDGLPESFFTLLNACLTYNYIHRPNATQILQQSEFVTLHQQKSVSPTKEQQQQQQQRTEDDTIGMTLDETTTEEDYDNNNEETKRSKEEIRHRTTATQHSSSLHGSVLRHHIFLQFQQYERKVTTLLATLLNKSELEQLIFVLNKRVANVANVQEQVKDNIQQRMKIMITGNESDENDNDNDDNNDPFLTNKQQKPIELATAGTTTGIIIKEQQQLGVVSISELKLILCEDLLKEEITKQIDKLSLDKNQYDNFAYHTALLNDFVMNQTNGNNSSKKSIGLTNSAHNVRNNSNSRHGLGSSIHHMTGSNASSVLDVSNSSDSSKNGLFKNMNRRKSTMTTLTINNNSSTVSSSMKRSKSTNAF